MATAPTTTPTPAEAEKPTALEEMAKKLGGAKEKIVEHLSSQERWNWYDVAVLLLGTNKAVAEITAKLSDESTKRYAKAEKAHLAALNAQREGALAGTATTTTQQATR